MKITAKWITAPVERGTAATAFKTTFALKKTLKKAVLNASAMGLYTAFLNGSRVTSDLFTPGFTAYQNRTQYQSYTVTNLFNQENTLSILAAPGWAVGNFPSWRAGFYSKCVCVIAWLDLTYTDGTTERIDTDTDWSTFSSHILASEIYHGETVDLTAREIPLGNAVLAEVKTRLIRNEGAPVCEQERLSPLSLIRTPRGETVLDFGQNMTGYVELRIQAPRGSRVVLHHAEVLDRDGNFYSDNLRLARNENVYICSGREDLFKPTFSFQGFRYVHLVEYPLETVDLSDFTAIVVHSEMERTCDFTSGNEKINQLYHNIVWGQKSNYLDIPTDCPQRDERLGWTGDAQVFCRTAAINYDVERFMGKWLGDMRADQRSDGAVPDFVPRCGLGIGRGSAAWGDAATVIPWQLYLAYGNPSALRKNFNMMRHWVEYMHHAGPEEYLWLGSHHYGDWLAMDNGEDSYEGATPTDLIGSAFFAHSTSLLIKAGIALGKDMSHYQAMYEEILSAFRSYFLPNGTLFLRSDLHEKGQKNPPAETQTAYALILYFNLCEEKDRRHCADRLASLIRENGGRMTTGFVGTPYLLHALTENGYNELAYDLLFAEHTPSWLYSVNHGATTMWEHWNGIKEDGSFWSTDMNSFNHYAYGAVFDWVFGKALGLETVENAPAYREITLTPHPDKRLGFAKMRFQSRHGDIGVHWYYKGETVYYEFEIPQGVTARMTLPKGKTATLTGGRYLFTEE